MTDRDLSGAVADAVLAAIGDRILPEIPEPAGVKGNASVVFDGSRYNAKVVVIHKPTKREPWLRAVSLVGTGPTIPAAIRDALEGQP